MVGAALSRESITHECAPAEMSNMLNTKIDLRYPLTLSPAGRGKTAIFMVRGAPKGHEGLMRTYEASFHPVYWSFVDKQDEFFTANSLLNHYWWRK